MRAVCEVFVPPPIPSSRSGWASPSSAKNTRRQRVVIVLAGMHQHLLVLLSQQSRYGGGLDELRSVADDGEDLHGRNLD